MTDHTALDQAYHAHAAVEQEFEEFWFGTLNMCGCGDPQRQQKFMFDVLTAISDRSETFRNIEGYGKESQRKFAAAQAPLEALVPSDTILGANYLHMLDAFDLTDHGGSVHGSWLSDKGKAALDLFHRWFAAEEAWSNFLQGEGQN